MSMPFYVSPEQLMKDKADYARKGIARGRSVVVLAYDKGIAFVAENPQSLRKISEIYDRIAFAAVGMYYEFENLRVAGIRYADLRGYSYDRSDVSARGLANAYAQTLGTVFTQEPKPYEIELVVAEVGETPEQDQIYRLTYDGSVADQHGFVVMGGASVQAESSLRERWHEGLTLAEALRLAVDTLAQDPNGGPARTLTATQLEVAVLDRQRPRRTFRRIAGPLLDDLLSTESPVSDAPVVDDGRPGHHDVLTGGLPVPETPGTDQPPPADADPGTGESAPLDPGPGDPEAEGSS
jgi:proteasome alpha subunit